MSDPTQKKLEVKSVGYKIGIAESERSLSNLGLRMRAGNRLYLYTARTVGIRLSD
jgi:hypothetical protein